MYKPPIEIVMKEVFQKMNEDFENSVLKAVQKVDINVDKEEKITSVYCDEYSEDYEYGYDATSAIDMELLKAINQQVKELGWLDD